MQRHNHNNKYGDLHVKVRIIRIRIHRKHIGNHGRNNGLGVMELGYGDDNLCASPVLH